MVSGVDLLMKFRHMIGVNDNNPFHLVKDNSDVGESLRGHDCICKAAVSANVQVPERERVTSTSYASTCPQLVIT